MKQTLYIAFALLIAAASAQFHLDLGAQLDLAGGVQTIAAGQTLSIAGRVNALVGAGTVDTGFGANLTVTNKGSTSATFRLYSALSANFNLGWNLASVIPSFGAGINLGLGFNSTFQDDGFTATLVLTPPFFSSASATQLFLVAEGAVAGSFYASQQSNFIGAIPALVVGQSVSFSLPTTAASTYLAASVSIQSSAVSLPCLFGVTASVQAGINAALNFGETLVANVQAAGNLKFQAAVAAAASLQANAQLQISGGLAGRVYTDLNAFYTISTADNTGEDEEEPSSGSSASFTAGLSFKLAAAAAVGDYAWGKINLDGTVSLLASAVANGKVSATVNAAGQYGVFFAGLFANGTFDSTGAQLTGGASFEGRLLLAGFAVSGGSSLAVTSTLGAIDYVCPVGLLNFKSTGYKLSASVSNSGASGKVQLYAIALVNAQASLGIGAAFAANQQVTLGYGIQVVTDLQPGTFSLNLTFTPPSFSASGNVQLYYFLDANGVAVSGNAKGSYAVSVPALPAFNGAVTFTLPSVQTTTYLLGSISESKGFVISPTAFGVTASVQANVGTTLAFGGNFFLQVASGVRTQVQASFSASFAGAVNFGASASANTYVALGAFYHFNVTDQSSLSADLIYTVNATVVAAKGFASKNLLWVFIAADGTATVLPTKATLDVSGNLAISATTNHFSTYAVYASSQYNNEVATQAKPSSSAIVGFSALFVALAALLAL